MEAEYDLRNLDPLDILAYLSEDLEKRVKENPNEESTISEFLTRWENDASIAPAKQINFEFPKDLDWFNVSKSLSISELRGKLVLLDFFTYCCINCMHVLPELHQLEQLYPTEHGLVVIGVHSPKFENEKKSANILVAAKRYEIQHAIVNDSESELWRTLGIRCWPTLMLLSPGGQPLLLLMGEGHGQFLERFVGQAIAHFKGIGNLKNFVLPSLVTTQEYVPANRLCFPSKITRSPEGNFAVADTGNHRIVVFTLDGKVLRTIPEGHTSAGFVDGDFAMARFNSPQGVTFLDEHTLLVADTKNHALRQIVLPGRSVVTLSGTGEQGSDRVGGKKGTLQALASPWDVEVFRTRDMDMSFHLDEHNVPEKIIVLISMSGTHQIWGYFPDDIILWKFRSFEACTCCSLVGNGLEENRNNSYPQNAGFAQPSGLAMINNNVLFIADSESSSVRKVSLLDGKVTAVVGGDRNPLNLFAYGDVDGKQYNAKLQHPLAVAYNHVTDVVYVADTYNNKLKQIDYQANSIATVAISEAGGQPLSLNEPAGLCFDASGRFLLLADTNNHQIKLVNIEQATAQQLLLQFEGTVKEISETDSATVPPKRMNASTDRLVKQLSLHVYKELELRLVIKLIDKDLKFTAEAPQKWSINVADTQLSVPRISGCFTAGSDTITLRRKSEKISTQTALGKESFELNITLNLCTSKYCLVKRFALVVVDGKPATPGASPPTTVGNETLTVKIGQNSINVSTSD